MKNILEVCAGDIGSVYAASAGGAFRVEICSALSEGGVTPSIGFIRKALRVPELRVHVLIRQRGGDFVYSPEEVECMVADIKAAREAGAHGVVVGALTPTGDIDMVSCRRMVDAAEGIDVTFHRAFDLCRNPINALEDIISLGCTRLLTSGQAPSALEGVELLRELVVRANGRITVLAGAGVSPSNAARILAVSGTNEIHASARAGAIRPTTSSEIVKSIVDAIK